MARLQGKVALITGAGRRGGIGEAIARRLAQEGCHIALADLTRPPQESVHPGTANPDEMTAIADEIRAYGVECLSISVDITDEVMVQAMVRQIEAEWGRLDILVNNAGTVVSPAPVIAMDSQAWRRTLDVNATGTFLCTKHALPLMVNTGGGRIINMSSIAAERPRPYMAAYAASKAAVIAFTKALAQEVAQYGITVNAIMPGDIDTPMKRWGFALEAQVLQKPEAAVIEELIRRIPVGRLGRPEDVANLVAFLVSEEAAFITGQAIAVTGGRELT